MTSETKRQSWGGNTIKSHLGLASYMQMGTYKAMLVRDVVGEFQFVKRHNFLHPLFACAGGVWMDVHPLGHLRVRLSRYHPSAGKCNYVSVTLHNHCLHYI